MAYDSTIDPLLLIYSDALEDIEGTRMATANRARALKDKKGMAGTPEAERLDSVVAELLRLERVVIRDLERAMRLHPLHWWIAETPGLGEKSAARLLGALGDPFWNVAEGRPRRDHQELWAYCGFHVIRAEGSPDHAFIGDHLPCVGVAPRRRKGQRANWNQRARKRAWLAAETAVKAGVRRVREPDDLGGYDVEAREGVTRFGDVYLEGRAKYRDAVHTVPCAQCSAKGKPPAPVGSPLSEGHRHARAIRLVAKQILAELFDAARELHVEERAAA